MNFQKKTMKTASLSFLLLGLISGAQAASISWGGAQFSNNYSADGTNLQNGVSAGSNQGTVSFAIGIFTNSDGSSFTPTLDNLNEWDSRFVSFGTAGESGYTDTNFPGTSLAENYFGGWIDLGTGAGKVSTTTTVAGNTLIEGRQVYLWGYDTRDTGGLNGAEWLLVTGSSSDIGSTDTNWLVPNDDGGNGDFVRTWDINNASTAIVGRINDNDGGGETTDPGTPLGLSDVQFATVPEPSSAFLILLGSLGLLRRRRS